VLGLTAVVVSSGSFVAGPAVAPLLGVIGWLTVTGFSRPPYAQLQLTGPAAVRAAHLGLADDLLIYLVAVVVVAVVGGFWPAVLAAVTSSLLLNWYFTLPLFITVAVTVSSVVHLAAHRAEQAARSGEEAARLREC
jgi:two-component system sensor histidine kinase KdpD